MIFVTDQRSICIAMRLRCKKAWVTKACHFTSLLGVWLILTLLIREKASQVTWQCFMFLNSKIQVNVNGGAIAFGHPLDEYEQPSVDSSD